jgi:hypothetical protein
MKEDGNSNTGLLILGAVGAGLLAFRWMSTRNDNAELERATLRYAHAETERDAAARRVLAELAAESPALARAIHERLARHEMESLRAHYDDVFRRSPDFTE